jgi:tripartite-type tricarboxylate transporter receptor subunit TctC
MKRLISCKTLLFVAIFTLIALSWSQGVHAQGYPTRPITLLISYAPGAGTDVCSRMMAQEASQPLGQEIMPVNKPGGGGSVMMGILANSKGDGYTIGASTTSALTIVPHMQTLPYDPFKDIDPIIQFGLLSSVIIVRTDSPFKSFKDLIAFARQNPGKVSYGVPGIATSPHLAMEAVMFQEKVNIAVIPFRGGTPNVTALLGGHVSSCGVSTSGFVAHLKAGKVRALATITGKRIDPIQEVPTLLELGYPNAVFESMYLMVAPKGTPPDVIKKLEEVFRKAMKAPEFIKVAKNFYAYAENPLLSQDLKDYLRKEYDRTGEIIRKTKIKK